MPETLHDLLHRAVDTVEAPRPDSALIAARGRRKRTRRRTGAVVVTIASVAVVVGVGAIATNLVTDDRAGTEVATTPTPSPVPPTPSATSPAEMPTNSPMREPDATGRDARKAYEELGAYAIGNRVVIGRTTVELPKDRAASVGHLVQTSAGVVAQQYTGTTSRFLLVRPDGAVEELPLPPEIHTIGGDPNGTRIASLTKGSGEIEVGIWEVTSGEQLAAVTVPDPSATPEVNRHWIFPVALDGDQAYVATDGGQQVVDWREGTSRAFGSDIFSVRQRVGVAAAPRGRKVLVDTESGTVIRDLGPEYVRAQLSPDGRSVLLQHSGGEGSPYLRVQPVAEERITEFPQGLLTFGSWTLSGHVLSATKDKLLRCSVRGDCEVVTTFDANEQVMLADVHQVG